MRKKPTTNYLSASANKCTSPIEPCWVIRDMRLATISGTG